MALEDFDWRQVIGSVAPGLAAALGGPLAGAAVKVIADKVLGRPDATQEEVAEALSSGSITGDQLVALKVAEQSFKLELERIDQQREAAGVEDTKSARQQTVDLAKEGSTIAWGAPVVSVMIVVGFFIAVYMLFIMERTWDERTANLLNVLFGALTVSFTSVTQYWLGSSAGSKRAGDAVRRIAEQRELSSK
jgi:ABC-type multidrug transport system permease subunit